MAKFGEGDPRWLVEERSDGRNVNAWHWEEKNVTNDALTRFKNLFQSFQLTDDQLFKISKVHSVTGDVTFCVRKQKPILLFELNAIFNWDGLISDLHSPIILFQMKILMKFNGN